LRVHGSGFTVEGKEIMKQGMAKLCNAPECQEIFDGALCPRCGSEGTFIGTWVPVIMVERIENEHPMSNIEPSSAEAVGGQ
jgi:hypothetical protein